MIHTTDKMETKRKKNFTLISPVTLSVCEKGSDSYDLFKNQTIQVSVHAIESTSYLRECHMVFPHVNVNNLISLPTMQHALDNLVSYGENAEYEKDRLLESVGGIIFSYISNFVS